MLNHISFPSYNSFLYDKSDRPIETRFFIYDIGNVDRVAFGGSGGQGSGNSILFYNGKEVQFYNYKSKDVLTRYSGTCGGYVRTRYGSPVLGIGDYGVEFGGDYAKGTCIDPRVIMAKILLLWSFYNIEADISYIEEKILNPVPSFQEARQWVVKNGFPILQSSKDWKGILQGAPAYNNAYSHCRNILLYPPKVSSRFLRSGAGSTWRSYLSPENRDWGTWPETWTEDHRRRWYSICESKQ